MQVFDQVLPSPTQSLNRDYACVPLKEQQKRKRKYRTKLVSLRERENTEYRGSERIEEIQHNKRIETVLSSEILRP